MRTVTTAIGLLLLGMLGVTTASYADTYSCGDPPDKLAKVGVSSTSTVSITQDKSAKECRISVNGVTVGSPPQDQVLSALNQFRAQGQAPAEIASRGLERYVDALAILLMAAAPVTQVPPEIARELRNRKGTIENCFRGSSRGSETSQAWDGDVACRFFEVPRNSDDVRRLDRYVGIVISSPTIEVSLRWGRDQYLSRVYFPRSMLNSPPLPSGFR